MAMGIMHCLAVKFCTMVRRMLAARWKIPMAALGWFGNCMTLEYAWEGRRIPGFKLG
jgi:hypothetical protein